MKIFQARFNGQLYKLCDLKESNSSNLVSVLIGKNGTGKSRILSSIVEVFERSQSYNQNHPNIKNNRVLSLEFENNGITTQVFSGRGKSSKKLIENNTDVRKNSPKKIIAASTSPFDKFPTYFASDKTNRNKLYSYIGLRLKNGQLSDKQLMNTFVQSLLDQSPKPAVVRTLKLLGYEPDIKVTFSHELSNLYRTNGRNYDSFDSWLVNDKKVHKIALEDNIGSLNQKIVKALSSQKQGNDKFTVVARGKSGNSKPKYHWVRQGALNRTRRAIGNVDTNLRLPKQFTFGSNIDSAVKLNLKDSLRSGLSTIETIVLKKSTGESFSIDCASSGERSLLLLVCSIANEIKNNSLICIDEPEISLHPAWQEQFIQLIAEVFKTYRNCHFIIATHSPLIISNLKSENCYILDLDNDELYNSNRFSNKSADFQLARLFQTPGDQNEYLKRLCVNILSELSQGKKLSNERKSDVEFLITSQRLISKEDTVYQLIDVIKTSLEVIGEH
ncbi:AAA family ATPase [Vibrio parahaemolyticus]|uniref:AAA family ATPase n=1 Tax=Vibrio parahaemolyticus TaxID=670 RepID=UPI0003F99F2B|nr:AAA family ATPase [Vibrio parahaemolyticus]